MQNEAHNKEIQNFTYMNGVFWLCSAVCLHIIFYMEASFYFLVGGGEDQSSFHGPKMVFT